MKQEIKLGTTDYTATILVRDTAGAAKTGLTNASAGIDVSYVRVETDNDVTVTAGAPVALATPALTDPHLDWGFLEIDATNHPGLYRLDIADGVFAAGAWSAVVTLIATGIDPVHIEYILVAATKDDIKAETALIVADTNELQTDWTNAGRLDAILDIIAADTTTDIPGLIATAQADLDLLTGADGATLATLQGNYAPNTVVPDAAGTAPTAAEIKTAIEAAGSHLALIKAVTDALTSAAATKLALSAGTIVTGTVSHDNTIATTTVFYSNDITEATADHYNGRIVIFTSGALQYQATDITDYALDTGEGKFTVTALTEAPADNVTFIIV